MTIILANFQNLRGIYADLGRDHTIKFSVQFVCINDFGTITSRRYFLEELLTRRKRLFLFFFRKLPKLSKEFLSL